MYMIIRYPQGEDELELELLKPYYVCPISLELRRADWRIRVKDNYNKRIILSILIGALTVLAAACGKTNKNEVYGPTIADLEDEELFTIIETNAKSPILLVTDQVCDDGIGNNHAAIYCDIYYVTDGEVKNIGTVESFGTAYPISYDKSGIYVGSGHEARRFEINELEGSLKLTEGVYETFDANESAAYTRETGEHTETITAEEYLSVIETYGKATVVNFGYGASGR